MLTLSIQITREGTLLVLQDGEAGTAEVCRLEDPFLTGLVLDAEFKLEQLQSPSDP
ncbi:MAG TPA: hypothetical protein VN436_12590 [Holophaga sp.]|nr:hypothetical protein [Holophaga sp.]